MKKIGIIGGLGPESTVDYYRRIIEIFNQRHSGGFYPEIIVYSTDINEVLEDVCEERWTGLTERLLDKIYSLDRAGAEFAVIASNTPHVVFEQVRDKSPLPMISIVDATCLRARQEGLKKPGLMGTKFTLQSYLYKKPFAERGMEVVVPFEKEQELIHHRLFSEIELGIIKESTRKELMDIARRLVEKEGIDSLILGCTELPLILPEQGFGIPFLNTTAIHVQSIVQYCFKDESILVDER
jgi:aspartate racemase